MTTKIQTYSISGDRKPFRDLLAFKTNKRSYLITSSRPYNPKESGRVRLLLTASPDKDLVNWSNDVYNKFYKKYLNTEQSWLTKETTKFLIDFKPVETIPLKHKGLGDLAFKITREYSTDNYSIVLLEYTVKDYKYPLDIDKLDPEYTVCFKTYGLNYYSIFSLYQCEGGE